MNLIHKMGVCAIALGLLGSLSGTNVAFAHSSKYKQNKAYRIIHHQLKMNYYNDDDYYSQHEMNQSFKHYGKYLTHHQLYQLGCHYGLHYFYTGSVRHYLNYFTSHSRHEYRSNKHLTKYSKMNNHYADAIRKYLIRDINRSRVHHGRRRLKVIGGLQEVADQRQGRIDYAYAHIKYGLKYHRSSKGNPLDSWAHGMWNHTTTNHYLDKDGFGDVVSVNGENCADVYKGSNRGYDNKPIHYKVNNPRSMAYYINDGNMHHDMEKGNNDGHRKNELCREFKYLGVSAHYSHGKAVIDEEFSN